MTEPLTAPRSAPDALTYGHQNRKRFLRLLPIVAAIVALASWLWTNWYQEDARALAERLAAARLLATLSAQVESSVLTTNSLKFELVPKVSFICRGIPVCQAAYPDRGPYAQPDDPTLTDGACRAALYTQIANFQTGESANATDRRNLIVRARILISLNETMKEANVTLAPELTSDALAVRDGMMTIEAVSAKAASEAKRLQSAFPRDGEGCAAFRTWRSAFDTLNRDIGRNSRFDLAAGRLLKDVDLQLEALSQAASTASAAADRTKRWAIALYFAAALLAIWAKWVDGKGDEHALD